ncbi:riboflavin synthase [Dethiosulfovibrio salsuginis]|uniref:Riboflavin synthase n=1 Tax=Dethiosulfovibrio salsuginis TaxID=561720 RepID=A0A1X7I6F8_9BACT|nr:riboflavin synthase [Dethiosulfovibrio salsuginis]SMG09864.1 riboflavin synthase alpha chain [Dethiosulfovibrio salsuginis]
MFTGLVEAVGRIDKITKGDGVYVLSVTSPEIAPELYLGQSVALSGACLTVCSFNDRAFTVEVTDETMGKTKFSTMKPGSEVNLERALCLSSRLDGHMVTGHVDGIAEIVGKKVIGRSWWLTFRVPEHLQKYVVTKGSICLDGVSLTVAEKKDCKFSIALIPTTIGETTLRTATVGDRLNLEVDIIARYVESLLGPGSEGNNPLKGISMNQLKEMGW